MVFASVGKKTTTSSVLPHSPVSAVSADAAQCCVSSSRPPPQCEQDLKLEQTSSSALIFPSLRNFLSISTPPPLSLSSPVSCGGRNLNYIPSDRAGQDGAMPMMRGGAGN